MYHVMAGEPHSPAHRCHRWQTEQIVCILFAFRRAVEVVTKVAVRTFRLAAELIVSQIVFPVAPCCNPLGRS